MHEQTVELERKRLARWLEPFLDCLGHKSSAAGCVRYMSPDWLDRVIAECPTNGGAAGAERL